MKARITASEFNAVLKRVYRAVDNKNVCTWMSGILLEADESNGTMVATAANGSQTVRESIACNVLCGGKILLDGKLLSDIVSKLPNGECEVDATDGKKAVVKAKGYKTNLSLLNADDFIGKFECEGKTDTISMAAAELVNAIKTVLYAAAIQDTRATLVGVNIESKGGGDALFCGLNGFQLAVCRAKVNGSAMNIIVPRKCASDIISVIPATDNEVRITTDGKSVVFAYGDMLIRAQLVAGEYINYRAITDGKKSTTEVAFDVRLFKGAVERVMLLGEGRNKLLILSVQSGRMSISARGDIGDAVEEIECSVSGEDIQSAYNGQFLLDALGTISEEEAKITFSSTTGPAFIKSTSGAGYLHCVLPVRIHQRG